MRKSRFWTEFNAIFRVCIVMSPPVVVHTGLVKAVGDEGTILKNGKAKGDGEVDLVIRPEFLRNAKRLVILGLLIGLRKLCLLRRRVGSWII